MRRVLLGPVLVLSACLSCSGAAAQSDGAAGAQTKPSASLFAKPVALRGTLGDAQIQMNLRPKTEFEDGIEGDYFVFGNSQHIRLAGELEGEDVFLEESENGTNISGQWEGKLSGDAFSGNWSSADGSVTKPFKLKAAQGNAKTTRASPRPARQDAGSPDPSNRK